MRVFPPGTFLDHLFRRTAARNFAIRDHGVDSSTPSINHLASQGTQMSAGLRAQLLLRAGHQDAGVGILWLLKT